ncbi:MAG TPA: ATP-binding protein [Cyclobacteriaceae bacterium]|nr:ATP-binding protein [Cyclobacteriaceae bacterium]
MAKTSVKVLLIEDDEDDVFLAREYLAESAVYKFEMDWESRPEEARKKMVSGAYDIFLIDYRLGSETGLDLIRFSQENAVLTPSILLTGQGDLKVDLDATRFGAADYLVKTELNASMLERSIRYALSQSKIILELNEKEKRYRSLFERSIDPIFLADQQYKLIDANESFLRFFKLTREQVLNLYLADIFHRPEDFAQFQATLKNNSQIRDFEVMLTSKFTDKKTCLVNCIFIQDLIGSSFCCYQGIIHDQTMRKKAEKDMLIAERLSMTGKIARTIAHEVRNPLTNLNLALDQLKDEMPSDNPSVKVYSDIIERNANRIEQLIGEMLSSSKPRDLNLELVPVNDVLDETLTLTIDRLNLNRMKLEKTYATELPRILVDKEKIKIALLNIIINATEAMEAEKGILKINTEMREGALVISIADNGKGIPPEEIEKLFDPFYTGKQGGMGLGLTSTKNILDSHAASVEVTSAPKVGTTFTIYFKMPDS